MPTSDSYNVLAGTLESTTTSGNIVPHLSTLVNLLTSQKTQSPTLEAQKSKITEDSFYQRVVPLIVPRRCKVKEANQVVPSSKTSMIVLEKSLSSVSLSNIRARARMQPLPYCMGVDPNTPALSSPIKVALMDHHPK